MYKAKFSIDGSVKEEDIFEGYTDGGEWNGWANVCFSREQLSNWLDSMPYDYHFFENTNGNQSVRIYFDDREDVIASTPLLVTEGENAGENLEGYFMESYCFVELSKI